MLHITSIYIAESEGRGRGVFTAAEVDDEEAIEICPLIFIPKEQLLLLDETIIYDYYFLMPDGSGNACLPSGYGMLYNHSTNPNAEVFIDLINNYMRIYCIKPIAAGEEIFINYQGTADEKPELWFDAK